MVIMYVEERVSTRRILLIRPCSAKALSPMRLHGLLWRKSVTSARKKEKKAMPPWLLTTARVRQRGVRSGAVPYYAG